MADAGSGTAAARLISLLKSLLRLGVPLLCRVAARRLPFEAVVDHPRDAWFGSQHCVGHAVYLVACSVDVAHRLDEGMAMDMERRLEVSDEAMSMDVECRLAVTSRAHCK